MDLNPLGTAEFNRGTPLKIAGIYLLICGFWILFSDRFLLWLAPTPEELTLLQTYKGWFFVMATALLLYALIRRDAAALARSLARQSRSEQRYRHLLEFSPEPVLVHRKGRMVYVNNAGTSLLGADHPHQIIGRPLSDFIHGDHREAVLEKMQSLSPISHPEETKLVRRDGSVVDIEVRTALAPAEEGDSLLVVVRDVSERKRIEEALIQSEERLNLALKSSEVGTWSWEIGENRMIWDDFIYPLFGLAPGEFPGRYKDYLALIHPDDRARIARQVARSIRDKVPFDVEYQVVWPDGSPHFLATRGKVCGGDGRSPRRLTGVSWDITPRKSAEISLRENEERMKYLAHHDVLTRLPNRLLLQDRIQHAIAKAGGAGSRVAVIFLDLDRFKTINDSLGYHMGNRVLQMVAGRLALQVRKADTVARLGGDEFVVVIEDIREAESLAAFTRKLLWSVSRVIRIDRHQLYVTASAGISLYPSDGDDVEGLLKSAETAMYRGKEEGKNTYQYFTPDMNARVGERLLLENGLRRALENRELVLHYQPQFDLMTESLVAVEALLRWEHPERGLVPPGDFIPLAEETGLIVPMGEWVLETACAQAKAWQDQGFPPLRMAVNISARQFGQRNLVDRIGQTLRMTGLSPDQLELEVTESLIMRDVEAAIVVMRELSAMGVHLAIDDFGTGYSSLSYLKRFPITRLKIDRSFVRDVLQGPKDAEIAAAVIALAHTMNLKVVAEGIETVPQLSFLRGKRCDLGQGFLFSRPLPAERITEMLGRDPAPRFASRVG